MTGKREDSTFRASTEQPTVHIRYVSPADAAVLDAMFDRPADGAGSRWQTGTAGVSDAARSARIAELLSLLDHAGPDESDTAHRRGVQATLDAVRAARQRERFATQVQMLTEPEPGIGIGWRQVLSAAAVFLVAVSLLFPVLEHNRSEARRVACASNLQQAGMAFGQYAAANSDMMPRGRVQPGGVWWNVGQEPEHEHAAVPSNTAHLFILIRDRYLQPDELACPENSTAFVRQFAENQTDWPSPEAVSYSYQNQYTAEPLRLNRSSHVALLADKNPLFVVRTGSMAFDDQTSTTAPSRIHDNRGQNVLVADGSVRWTVRPLLSVPGRGEPSNFWIADGQQTFTGTELPSSPDDSFLVP